MATLYELTQDYLELLDMMQDPDVDPEIFEDTLEAVEGDLEVKADSYCIVMKELEAELAKWKAEKDRADKYVSTIGNNIKRMKAALLDAMQATGKDKLPTEHFNLSIRKNGGLAPLRITGDVPAAFCKLEPDNAMIRATLDGGGKLEFAVLEERGVHLDIR